MTANEEFNKTIEAAQQHRFPTREALGLPADGNVADTTEYLRHLQDNWRQRPAYTAFQEQAKQAFAAWAEQTDEKSTWHD